MKRVLGNIGWLLASRGVNAAFSLIYLALAARALGLADFGRFSLIVVMAQAINGLASFNSWQAVVRWGSIDGEAACAAGFSLALDLLSVAAGGALAAIVVWSAPLWLPLSADARPAALGLCLAALLATRSTPTGVLRLHDRYDLAMLAEAVLPVTRAAGAMLAASAFPTIAGFAAAWAVAELACAAAYWRLAHKVQPIGRAEVSLSTLPRRHDGVWPFVFATNLSRSLAVAPRQVLLLLVGSTGGAALAAGFRMAAQLGQALVQLGEASSRAIYPELVRAGNAYELAAKTTWLALVTGIIAVTAAALAGGWVLEFVAGPEFAFAHRALVMLALAGALELLGASWEPLLLTRGNAGLAFSLRAVPLVFAFLLLAPLTARYGIDGAAACVLLSSALAVGGLGYAAWFRAPEDHE